MKPSSLIWSGSAYHLSGIFFGENFSTKGNELQLLEPFISNVNKWYASEDRTIRFPTEATRFLSN